MIVQRLANKYAAVVCVCLGLVGLVGSDSAQAAKPVRLVLSSHIGSEVNLTEVEAKGGMSLEDVCTVASNDTCQPGSPSKDAGGLEYPESVAGAPDGDIYVTDKGNHRVDVFKPNGEFVLMFGAEVDGTTKEDVCTAASGDTCQAGSEGTAGGLLPNPESVAADPTNGDIYVAESIYTPEVGLGQRVQKFLPNGEFVYEIGKEVDTSTKANLCTEEDAKKGVLCGLPAPSAGSNGEGVIVFPSNRGNVLAAGGERDSLYVGSEHSIQWFEADGSWRQALPADATVVTGLAVDDKTNDVYAIYDDGNLLHKFDSNGGELASVVVNSTRPGAEVKLAAIAIDGEEHVALAGAEELEGNRYSFGTLYSAETGLLLTKLALDEGVVGATFNGANMFFDVFGQEMAGYLPETVAEVVTGAQNCTSGPSYETSATFNCALAGEVDSDGISGTEAWFEWGRTCDLGSATAAVAIPTGELLEPTSAVVSLRPNEKYCYVAAAADENARAPEQVTGRTTTFETPRVRPEITGVAGASFVKAFSAVFSAEVNPENSDTTYGFEYGQCANLDACPHITSTTSLSSNAYGKIAAVIEAVGLSPSTAYRFRLTATNEHGEKNVGCGVPNNQECEQSFTTAPAPVPTANTGASSALGSTSAVISGSVDANGQPAIYMFESGVYEGAATRFGVIQSGSVGTVPVTETTVLSGLQPGVAYAYRIVVRSAYGSAIGAAETFTTTGTSTVLAAPLVPALLPAPNVKFPSPVVTKPKPKCKRGVARNRRGKCVKKKGTKKRSTKGPSSKGKSRK